MGFALIIFLWLGFREPHRLAFHAPVAYAAIMAVMGSLLFIPRLSLTWCARSQCLAREAPCSGTLGIMCLCVAQLPTLRILQSLQAHHQVSKLIKLF